MKSWVVVLALFTSVSFSADKPAETKLSSMNKIELSSLIEQYMVDDRQSTSLGEYSTLKKTTSPILWETVTKGHFIATHKGVPAFLIYDPYEKAVPWTIELIGSRTMIDRVELTTGYWGEWNWDPVEVLRKQNFSVKHIECFNEPPVGGIEKYHITKASKKVYLIKSFSSGSAGTGIDLTLMADAPTKGGCWDNSDAVAQTPTKAPEYSADYAGRIRARIKPNIVFLDKVNSNPEAEVTVRIRSDGTIIGSTLSRSSGVASWDKAVLRAVDKTQVLPRDANGKVPPSLTLVFRPKE